MQQKPDKLAVLLAVKNHKRAISMPELLAKLGSDYAERSVRRWLNEWIEQGDIEKIGQKRATRYLIPKSPQGFSFSESANACIGKTKVPLFERDPIGYQREWLDEYQPNIDFLLPQQISESLYQQGQQHLPINEAGTFAKQIYDRLLIDLSYNSSRLEGNTYSLLDTEKLLMQGLSKNGALDEERIMIINHKEAIRYLVKQAKDIHIDNHTIFTLHYLLSDGLLDAKYTGHPRDHSVRISGSTYITLENPAELTALLHRISLKAQTIKHPLEQSFFLLVHISYLQAFADVNKRTARLSANIPLIHHNLAPLSFNDINKDDYINAMIAIYEQNQTLALAELFAHSYQRSCKAFSANTTAIGFDEVRVRYRQQRRELISSIINQQLYSEQKDAAIAQYSEKIPAKDRQSFIKKVQEDLLYLSPARIAGLSVSQKAFDEYLRRA